MLLILTKFDSLSLKRRIFLHYNVTIAIFGFIVSALTYINQLFVYFPHFPNSAVSIKVLFIYVFSLFFLRASLKFSIPSVAVLPLSQEKSLYHHVKHNSNSPY